MKKFICLLVGLFMMIMSAVAYDPEIDWDMIEVYGNYVYIYPVECSEETKEVDYNEYKKDRIEYVKQLIERYQLVENENEIRAYENLPKVWWEFSFIEINNNNITNVAYSLDGKIVIYNEFYENNSLTKVLDKYAMFAVKYGNKEGWSYFFNFGNNMWLCINMEAGGALK